MPTWGTVRFDKWQFAGRRSKAVSADTEISFADFQFMHIHRRQKQQERRLETPDWAVNDKLLRQVVLNAAEKRLYLRPNPKFLTDEQRLARIRETELRQMKERYLPLLRDMLARYKRLPKYRQSELAIQIQNVDSQCLMATRGIVAIMVSVVYHYFRNGYDSVTVAETLRLHPPHVRQILAHLFHNSIKDAYNYPERAEARRLIVEALEKKRAAQAERRLLKRKQRWTKAKVDLITRWLEQGMDWKGIAKSIYNKRTDSAMRSYRYFIANPHKLWDSPEQLAERSSPEYKARLVTRSKADRTPPVRRAIGKATRARWADPDYRRDTILSMVEAYGRRRANAKR